MPEKTIKLQPETSYYFWWFIAGIFLIPLLGFGIYLIYRKKRELNTIVYHVADQRITEANDNYSETIDLVNIQSIDIKKRWIDGYFDIGTLLIHTGNCTMKMIGMKNPERLSDTILTASKNEKLRLEKFNQTKKRTDNQQQPGSLDRIDYLTGLWQQGLLSDEDYRQERKHFES